jgi:hypothetical protein
VPPEIRVGHVETPSPFTEFGIKGGGEGGRMGAPPAIAAAIEDALQPLGVRIDALPVTLAQPARPDPRGRSAPTSRREVAGDGTPAVGSWVP